MKDKNKLRILFVAQGIGFALISASIDKIGLGLLLAAGVIGIGWIVAGLGDN